LLRLDAARLSGPYTRNNTYKYGQIPHYVLATVADDERVGRIDHSSLDTFHIFI
jgi:hypothetical protein